MRWECELAWKVMGYMVDMGDQIGGVDTRESMHCILVQWVEWA